MGEMLEYQLSTDIKGKYLDGGQSYLLRLRADMPKCIFWSVLVYNDSDQLIISTDQPWPSIHSNLAKLTVNEDGSVHVYFGPKAPLSAEKNWIKTLAGKKWYAAVRFYNLLEPFTDTSWRPGDIVKISDT